MIALTEALAEMAARFADGLAWGESQEIGDVLDAATAWMAGELPLEVFANTGTTLSPVSGKPSAAYARYLATIATAPGDPRRADLLRAIDALLDFQGYRRTDHGLFESSELAGVRVIYRPANERLAS